VSKSLVALRIRSSANGGEHAAEDWGSRGRRFKSCHPDGKQQVRGRFGQDPRRPLCCRVAIGVATAHVLTSPLLLRTAGRRSAPSVETAARRYAVAPPPRACARQISATACADRHRSFPKPWLPLIARSAPPRVGCCPAPRGEDEARLNQDRGRLEPLDCLARLDPPKSDTVAGERGTLRGERSVLGSLMTRCPLALESVPRTRRMLFGELDVSALSSSMRRHVCRPSAVPVAEYLPIVPATRGLPRVRRIT
jgi:hypothetical protein